MSFGFSIGDFLATAILIKDIVKCIKNSGGAASEYQELMDELHGLQIALNKIEQLQGNAQQAEAVNSIKVAALNCQLVLQDFSMKLKKYHGSLERGNSRGWIKDSSKKVKWELAAKSDVQNLRAYLQAHTGSINMRLSLEGLTTTYEIVQKTTQVQEILEKKLDDTHIAIREVRSCMRNIEQEREESKRRKILEWLSPVTMQEKQDDNYSRSQKNTGEWLLTHEIFKDWMEDDGAQSIIWCPGNPGTGKTIMTSIVVDHIQKRYPSKDVGISYIYCDYKERRSALTLIATLARQLTARKSTTPTHLLKLYERNKYPDGQQLKSLLLSLCGCFKQTFVLIDALDECTIGTERALILFLVNELQEASVKTFITSRPNLNDINRQLGQAPRVDIVASESDIRTYLKEKMANNSRFMNRVMSTSGLDERIVNTVMNRAAGMFLMAVLQFDRICTERTPTKIIMALQSLPSKLEDTYKDTLLRIQSQPESDSVLAMKVLQWISRAKRPLDVDELRHALSVEWEGDGSPPKQLDVDNLVDPEDILDVCAGLVVIENKSKIIRLVHFTTQEFFLKSESILIDADIQISKTCIAYLSFDVFRRQSFTPYELNSCVKQLPFLKYAVKYWGVHLQGKPEQHLEGMALDFLNTNPLNLTGLAQLTQPLRYPRLFSSIPTYVHHMTGLHFASIFGLRTIIEKLIFNKSFEIDHRDDLGQTPLSKAAEYGHEVVVRLLLEIGADINAKDNQGWAPLLWATLKNQLATARMLIEAGAEVDSQSESGHTALRLAVFNLREDTVKLLLDKGAEINHQCEYGYTALQYAVEVSAEDIVKLLLDRSADVNSEDMFGERALSKAAKNDLRKMVKLLIDRGANIGSRDKSGRTALLIAAKNGCEHITKLLLDSGAEVDSRDKDGRTALFVAARNGYKRITKLLLDSGAKVEIVDRWNNTPHSMAVKGGHSTVEKLLRERYAQLREREELPQGE